MTTRHHACRQMRLLPDGTGCLSRGIFVLAQSLGSGSAAKKRVMNKQVNFTRTHTCSLSHARTLSHTFSLSLSSPPPPPSLPPSLSPFLSPAPRPLLFGCPCDCFKLKLSLSPAGSRSRSHSSIRLETLVRKRLSPLTLTPIGIKMVQYLGSQIR